MERAEDSSIEWVRQRVAEVRQLAARPAADDLETGTKLRTQVVRELEFLRTHASDTEFYSAAENLFRGPVYAKDALVGLAEVLDGWIRYVEEGFATSIPLEVRIRHEAATDLMEQVQLLLEDMKIHPATPIILAGASLEEFLRGLVEGCNGSPPSKPGIAKYAETLRRAEVIDAQDVKDLIAWAGIRNAAAHGEFDKINIDRARLMIDGVNLFMRQRRPGSMVK